MISRENHYAVIFLEHSNEAIARFLYNHHLQHHGVGWVIYVCKQKPRGNYVFLGKTLDNDFLLRCCSVGDKKVFISSTGNLKGGLNIIMFSYNRQKVFR